MRKLQRGKVVDHTVVGGRFSNGPPLFLKIFSEKFFQLEKMYLFRITQQNEIHRKS